MAGPDCHGSIALAAFVALLTLSVTTSLRPSDGCKRIAEASLVSHKKLVKNQIHVADFEDVLRAYWVQAAPDPSKPSPLLLAIHGQTQDAADFGTSHDFFALGRDHNLMTVFPQGMDDSYPGEEQGTGWNVGSAGKKVVCLPTGVGTARGCYKSCRTLNKCGPCNWSTCYDDALFIKTMIEALAQDFCIDLDRIYAHGESNGAMMVHHLVRELPTTFAGISTWFGTPLLGFLLGSQLQLVGEQLSLSRTALLAFHGRNDTTIPPEGGVTESGWIHEPLEQSTGVWASVHHCKQRPSILETRWDGGPLNFKCVEYRRCSTGRQIIQCMYDGVHGDWPTGSDGDEMTLWFLLRLDRSSPLAPSIAQDRAEALDVARKSVASAPKGKGMAPEAPATVTETEEAKNAAIADYINRKPIQAPTMPPRPEPTNAPSKITPEQIADGLP